MFLMTGQHPSFRRKCDVFLQQHLSKQRKKKKSSSWIPMPPYTWLARGTLNAVELEAVRKYSNPTKVITVSEEVQTNEDTTKYVKDVDRFVTIQLLKDKPSVLSIGKLFEDHGYSYEWTGWSKTTLKNAERSTMQCGELRDRSCPRFFERIFEFQYGTSAYFVFIKGLSARRIYAETSKKKIEKES